VQHTYTHIALVIKHKTVRTPVFPKPTDRSSANHIRIPVGIVEKLDKMILKFMWNCKYGTTKTILERNSKVDEYKT
jgi:hypothetical protein